MIQISSKRFKKSAGTVIHLITDYRLLITSLAFALTGCMGVYEGGFECPPGEGVGCKSISEVNEMVDRRKLPKGELSEIPNCKTCGESSQPSIWYSPWFYRKGNDIYESI